MPDDSTSDARSALAPTGTLRVGPNMSHVLLTGDRPVTGEPCGLAADLGASWVSGWVSRRAPPHPNPGAR